MNKAKKADAETRKAQLLKMSASERRIDAFLLGYERGYDAGRLDQSKLDSPYIYFYQMYKRKEEQANANTKTIGNDPKPTDQVHKQTKARNGKGTRVSRRKGVSNE